MRQKLPHIDRKHRIKFFRGFARKHVQAGRVTQALHLRLDFFSRQGVEPHDRFLALVEVSSFEFFDFREQLHLREVEDLRHFHAGGDLVSLLDIGSCLAEAAAPARPVLQD